MKERTKYKIMLAIIIFGLVFFSSASIIAYGGEGGAIYGLGCLSGMGLISGIVLVFRPETLEKKT